MTHTSYPIQMEIAGDTAMWTRPDTGDTPCSYPAPTYGAVRAIFESVLWGPDVIVVPRKVEICRPVRYHSYVTNYGGPLRKRENMKEGTNYQLYATVLVDVCYRLYAEARPNPDKERLPESAKQWDGRTTSPGHAYQAIFSRRLKRGQAYSIPALGWREFTPSYFGPFREGTRVCDDLPDIVIPSMLRESFSNGYASEFRASYDTDLMIHKGVLLYPERRAGGDAQ